MWRLILLCLAVSAWCVPIEPKGVLLHTETETIDEYSGASGTEIVITESGDDLAVESGASGECLTEVAEHSGQTIIWESGFSGELVVEEHESSMEMIEESGCSGESSGVEASAYWESSAETIIEESGLGSGESGDLPEIVIIQDGSGQEVIIIEDISGADSSWCAGVPDGFYALGCSSTVRACTGGVAEDLQCPDNLAFDPEKGACDSPANVHLCTGLGFDWQGSGESIPAVMANASSWCALRGDGFFQKGCSAFLIACSEGHERTLFCPDGLVYNQAKGYCDSPQDVDACSGEGSDL